MAVVAEVPENCVIIRLVIRLYFQAHFSEAGWLQMRRKHDIYCRPRNDVNNFAVLISLRIEMMALASAGRMMALYLSEK